MTPPVISTGYSDVKAIVKKVVETNRVASDGESCSDLPPADFHGRSDALEPSEPNDDLCHQSLATPVSTPPVDERPRMTKRKGSQDSGDASIEDNPFLRACWHNNVQDVKELLSHDDVALLMSCELKGNGALHIAVMSGYVDLTRLLLNHTTLLSQRNDAEETPLHVACQYLFTDVQQHVMDVENVAKCAELLIKAGCDVMARDSEGHCALHALLMGSFLVKGPDSRLSRLRFRLVQLILSSARSILVSDLPNPNELSSDLTEEHADILQWLRSFLRTPRSLQHMCRVTVRQAVGEARLSRMDELPCTTTLAHYLTLN